MPTQTQTRVIKISVDTKGSRDIQEIAKQMGLLNSATKDLASGFKGLQNTFGLLFGASLFGVGIRQITEFSDTMQNLQNRIAAVSGSQEFAKQTLVELLGVAQRTNQSIDAVGEAYARFQVSLQKSGISSRSLLEVVEGLTNSFRLSGSTAAETQATIIQLSQAFSSGVLRGQELRSVMLQNATVASLLRERFGKNLFKVAESGGITVTEVFKILFKSMDDINNKANQLAPTFEQVMVKAFNQLKAAIGDLNSEFNLSGKFGAAMDTFIEKLGLIGVALGVLALTQIPAAIAAFEKLYVALNLLVIDNPVGAALVGIAFAVVLLFDNLTQLHGALSQVQADIQRVIAFLLELEAKMLRIVAILPKWRIFGTVADQLQLQANFFNNFSDSIEEDLNKIPPALRAVETESEKYKRHLEDLKKLQNSYGSPDKILKVKDVLAALNKEFLAGKIQASEYSAKLINFGFEKLNIDLRNGKISFEQFIEGTEKLRQQQITKYFNDGRISLEEFDKQIADSKIQVLNEQLNAGTLSIAAYRIEFAKLTQDFSPGGALNAGTQAYINSIGTTTNQVAKAIEQTFNHLEDSMFEFIKTGIFNFSKFTQAILDDLTRIILRATIIAPLARGILSLSTPTASDGSGVDASNSDFSNVAAKGAYFDGPLAKFASGGIVNSPTTFGYGRDRRGLMGEAGPEAILPLTRGSGGKLGVQAQVSPVTINVINQNGSAVETRESTGPNGAKMIDVIITNKVKEGIANGSYDKTFQQSYGLKRKGS